MKKQRGDFIRWTFFATRIGVLVLFVLFAAWTRYLNLKTGYNNPRLVELAHGEYMRTFYEASDSFFGWFGDPLAVAQSSGGIVWSATILGVPLTDPMAAMSMAVRGGWPSGAFILGLLVPLALALLFGRVFCASLCPASLVFYVSSRLRRFLKRWFYLPDLNPGPGLAWGVLVGGLVLAVWFGHGVWSMILPYVAMGQTAFHAIAFENTMADEIIVVAGSAFGGMVLADVLLGDRFVCRQLCPTGRVLSTVGRFAPVRVQRNAAECAESCVTCQEICPFGASPKKAELSDCSLCGECLSACPAQCLTVGRSPS